MHEYDHLDLPDNPTIEGLRMLIGDEALAQLSVDYGGSVISIPLKAGENSPISFSIGQRAAQKISDIWGGMSFTVPLRPGKKMQIMRHLNANTPVNKICRLVGVSRTEVYRIIAEKDADQQLDMF